MRNEGKRLQKQDVIFLCVFLITLVIYLVGLQKSINWEDEAFYPTVAFRLLKGDALVADEWHLSQFSSFFMYLPVRFWYGIKGSMDGWIVFSRCVFLTLHAATSAFLYTRLRRFGTGGVIAAILYFSQAPMRICALSYNSLCMTFVLYIALLLFTQTERPQLWRLFLLGFFYACAVVCNPIFILAFPVYALFAVLYKVRVSAFTQTVVLAFAQRHKKDKRSLRKPWLTGEAARNYLGTKPFFTLCGGIAVVAAAAIVFFFATGGTLHAIAENYQNLLSDVAHDYFSQNGDGFKANLMRIADQYLLISKWFCWLMPVSLLTVLLDRKKTDTRRLLYAGVGLAVMIFYIIRIMFIIDDISDDNTFFWLLPFGYYSLLSFLLLRQKNWRVFLCLWMPGFVYSFFQCFSSNMGIIGLGFGLAVSNIAGALFAAALYKELRRTPCEEPVKRAGKAAAVLVAAALCLQGGCQLITLGNQFLSIGSLRIQNGPYSHTRIDYMTGKTMECAFDDLERIKALTDETDNVLLLTQQPWMYLYLDRSFATYSAWMIPYDIDRLFYYFEVNPEKTPDCIYICALSFPDYQLNMISAKDNADLFCERFNCTVTKVKRGYILQVHK